jgi:hypothetical protein
LLDSLAGSFRLAQRKLKEIADTKVALLYYFYPTMLTAVLYAPAGTLELRIFLTGTKKAKEIAPTHIPTKTQTQKTTPTQTTANLLLSLF